MQKLHLDPTTKQKFYRQLSDLFVTFDTFWDFKDKYNFRIRHDLATNTLIVYRERECVSCKTITTIEPITERNQVTSETSRPNTILCPTCSAKVGKLLAPTKI